MPFGMAQKEIDKLIKIMEKELPIKTIEDLEDAFRSVARAEALRVAGNKSE